MKKITLKAILLVAIVLCGMTNTLKAATITVSADAVVAGSNYNTIQAAYDYVKALPTLTEKYIIELQSSFDPTSGVTLETFPITFTANTASAEFDITIKPATGAKIVLGPTNQTVIASGVTFASGATSIDLTGLITSGNISQISTNSYISGIGTYTAATFKKVAGITDNTLTLPTGTIIAANLTGGNKLFFGPAQTQAINFNGASYVTIDGVSRTDAATGLTIQNPNSIYAQTINFMSTATYNTVKNCIIRGANQTGAWNNGYCGTVYFNGSHHNSISNNDVCDMNDTNIPMPINVFWMTGTGVNYENTISDNNIYNASNDMSPNGNSGFFQFGSTSNASSYNNNILNNRIYWTKTANFRYTFYVIGMGGSMNGLGNRFEGNIIGWQADGLTRAELTTTASTISFYGTNVKNCTFKNNIIGGINFAGKVFVGFQLFAHNTSSPNADDVCSGNQVKDITVNSPATGGNIYGIMQSAACPFIFNFKNNTIKNITLSSSTAANTNTIQGILYNFGFPASNGYAINCIGNEVSNLTAGDSNSSANNNITAFVQGGCATNIQKNLIYNLKSISTGTGSIIKGFRFATSNATGVTLKNNIVRLGTDVSSDVEISAIINEGLSNNAHPFNIYHNTVYVGGTSQTKPSHCLSRSGAISGAISAKNNIFSNVRTGGAAVNQIYNLYALTDVIASEYNLYQYGSLFGTVTTTTPATFTAMSDWNIEKLDFETGSKDQLDPLFTDATATTPDMHLPTNSPTNEAGLAIETVTDDFAGLTRADYTTASTTKADMGAYAISNSTAIESAKQLSNLSVYATQNNILFSNLSGKNASIYSFIGQLTKSVKLTSDNVNIPTAKGLYIVKVGENVTKVMVK